ncbi:MAG: hypothetical protein K2O80_05005, partial [Helicobacter apodemus]|nr:hypothetical protein [Helicobacter apodemus]
SCIPLFAAQSNNNGYQGKSQQNQQNVEIEERMNLGVWYANERLRWIYHQQAIKENRPSIYVPVKLKLRW